MSRQGAGTASGTGKSGIPLATSQHRPHLLQYAGEFFSGFSDNGACTSGGIFLHFFTSLNMAIRLLMILNACARLARLDRVVHHRSCFSHPRFLRT
jgi:hypothetical protein